MEEYKDKHTFVDDEKQAYAIGHYLKLQNPVIEVKFCEGNIFVIDIENILYIFDSSFSLYKKKKLTKNGENQHFYCNAFSISKGSVSVPVQKNLVWVQCDEEIKAVHKTDVHLNTIVFTSYCASSRYLLSASEDGRVYLHDTNTKTIRYIFANKPDYCSYTTISQENRLAFVAYYNGENTLLNLQNDTIVEFETKYPVELASFFDDEKRIFLADRQGNSIIYDCVEHTIISQKVLFTQWVSCIVLAPNKKFLIVATRTEKLYLVDPYKNELIKTLILPDSGVTSMDIEGDILLLSCTNGTVLTINLAYEKEQFLIHLNLKEYAQVKEILDGNYFLSLDDSFEKFRAGFEEVLVKAKEYITKQMIDKALDIVAPFMDYLEYREKLDQLFIQQDHIASFMEAVEKKDILNAYLIAEKYPLIESLNIYLSLEKQWEIAFAKARKILEEDPLHGAKKAQEFLIFYERIPKKSDLVRYLLANKNIFIKADSAIKKQDFASYFKYCQKFSFLQGTNLYTKVENLGYSMQRKALEYYQERKFDKAKEVLQILLDFPSHKNSALKEISKIECMMKFIDCVESEQKATAYTMANENSFLSFVDAFEKLNKPFEEKMHKAFISAKSGDAAAVRRELFEYIEIKELHNKIDSCMKIAYLQQFESCDLSQIQRDLVLKKYTSLFGLDDLIEAIFDKKGYREEFQNFAKAPKTIDVRRYEDTLFT